MVGVVRECPGDDWEDRRGHSGFGEALPHPHPRLLLGKLSGCSREL